MRHTILYVGAVVLAWAYTAGAQAMLPLAPQARVRVSAPTRQLTAIVGRFIEQRGDSLLVRGERIGDTLHLSLREIAQLDVSRRSDTHMLAGAGIGALSGGAVGAIAGYA